MRAKSPRFSRTGTWLAIACAVLAATSACSNDPAASTSESKSETGSGWASDSSATAARTRLAPHLAGSDREPPTTGPAAEPGKKVWIISCGEANEGCRNPSDGAKEAATAIGWDATVFDGKFDPAQQALGVRQAVAAKTDVIVLVAVDCQVVKQPLEAARAAGVEVIGLYSYDCSDPLAGGSEKSLFSGTVQYDTDPAAFFKRYGAVKADLLIAKLGEDLKVLNITQNEVTNVHYFNLGFEEQLKVCEGCEIVEDLEITRQDVATAAVQAKVSAALQRHPDLNAVQIPYDGLALLGVSQAIVQSGRGDALYVEAGEGYPSAIKVLVANKGTDVEFGLPGRWVGWAAIDSANRVLHEVELADSGIGLRIIDRESGASDYVDGYDGTKDYQAAYKKAWGITS